MGYFLIYSKIKIQHAVEWEKKVDQDSFRTNQLKMASIAISFPYQPDQKEFEMVDETIQLKGNYYHILKKRYEAGTLHIVYVDDHTSLKIQKEFENWTASSCAQHEHNQIIDLKNILQNIDHQYVYSEFAYASLFTEIFDKGNMDYYLDQSNIIYLSIPAPPPKSFS